tara:strand:+ start:2654 stop:4105 length:1452 start_codon:yes stop_codon:yes gene_type:complete
MTLEQILDQTVQENPDEFSLETVERVKKFVGYEVNNLDKPKPWRYFNEIDDFVLYHRLHPEWEGKSTDEIQREKIPGAYAFYRAMNKFVNRTTQDKDERKTLRNRIFEPKYNDWSSYTTIDQWIDEYSKHPEWGGISTDQMQKGNFPDLYNFYDSFNRWLEKIDESLEGRKKLREHIFNLKNNSWTNFTSIDEWMGEYGAHPEWHGKSTWEMQSDKHGGSAFYGAFNRWVNNQTEDKDERKKLMKSVFKPKQRDWSSYQAIYDWMEEFNINPEWYGRSTKDMDNDTGSGASAFMNRFRTWSKENSTNERERNAYIRSLFPERQAPFAYNFGNGERYFDSFPERVVGILLHQYNLADDFIEGENLHVRTNGSKQNSIDFLIGKNLIEFHPLNRQDKERSLTVEETGEYKKDNITNPEFRDFDFYHIWNVEQLYDVLKQGYLGSRRFADLTIEQFKKDLTVAYRLAIGYDSGAKQNDAVISDKVA